MRPWKGGNTYVHDEAPPMPLFMHLLDPPTSTANTYPPLSPLIKSYSHQHRLFLILFLSARPQRYPRSLPILLS